MRFIPKNIRKHQEGGELAPAEQSMEQDPAAGQDPIMMLALAAAQALQGQDCLIAMQVCEGLIQMLQLGGGGEAPAEEPVFAKKGGKLIRKSK